MTIRTRYAPSPTGYLHVGGLRTALYNYLFARQNRGNFVLRIEDTDQTRRVEGAVENLIEVLAWLGIEYDEGPSVGGRFGPYVQSERLEIYRTHVKRLADGGHAYPCFCSAEDLKAMRADQSDRGVPPMYDRRCRKIPATDAASRIEAGEAHVWRMAVPDNRNVLITDLIRGEVRFEASTVDDQVLLKSDGFPTYHLANVVDDHLMQISHVIRGEEWLPSTPKHALLYEFFGWDVPQFAHLPLLLNPDRSKMSKRSGDVAVEDYRRRGILPQALINFVALLGWHPSDEREIFSLAELIHEFTLDRVGKAGAIFDLAKLMWMNAEYIKAESDDVLFEHIRPLLLDLIKANGENRVRYAMLTLRGGAEGYEPLAQKIRDVFAPLATADPEMMALLNDASAREVVAEFAKRMAEVSHPDWNDFVKLEAEFKTAASEAGAARNVKGKNLWRAIRAALTGQPHGPELAKLVGIWGRERVLVRLQRALAETEGVTSK
jgi:nondiscriminating glutamyl-tRNA synthetase